jgi:hypothetical protein
LEGTLEAETMKNNAENPANRASQNGKAKWSAQCPATEHRLPCANVKDHTDLIEGLWCLGMFVVVPAQVEMAMKALRRAKCFGPSSFIWGRRNWGDSVGR